MPEPLITNSLNVETYFVSASGTPNHRNNNESPPLTENDSSSSLSSAASPTPRTEESTSSSSIIEELKAHRLQFRADCTTDIEETVIQPEDSELAPEELERYTQEILASVTDFKDTLDSNFKLMIPPSKPCSLSKLAACLNDLLTLLNEQIKETDEIKDEQLKFFKLDAQEFYNTFAIIIKNIWEKITAQLNTLKKNVNQLFLSQMHLMPNNKNKILCIFLLAASPETLTAPDILLKELLYFSEAMQETNLALTELLQEFSKAYKKNTWPLASFFREMPKFEDLSDIIRRLDDTAGKALLVSNRPPHRSSTYAALEFVISSESAQFFLNLTTTPYYEIPDTKMTSLSNMFLALYAQNNWKPLHFSFSKLYSFIFILSELIKTTFEMDRTLLNKTCIDLPDWLRNKLYLPREIKNHLNHRRKPDTVFKGGSTKILS